MRFSDWEPIYESILSDMGYSRAEDESAVRVLKAVTINSDLIDDDEASEYFDKTVTVIGNSPGLIDDIRSTPLEGAVIASGSAVHRLMSEGILPDVVVTDLDGEIESQIEASNKGALTFIHAHGDNVDLIREYAWRFKGPVVLTTQSTPENTVSNYGGFTDGDRAVCIACHFGARSILLLGFEYENPMPKEGSDPLVKKKKLEWAEKIIETVAGNLRKYPKVYQVH